MGTVNTNFLPATTGLNLGSPDQSWNGYFQNVVLSDIVTMLGTTSGNPALSISSAINLITMTLSGNVAPTITGVPGMVMFSIAQNSTGGWVFTWPSGTVNGMTVGTDANQISYQLFMFDGTNLIAMTPGLLNP
jgi:hypothetical protein